MAAAVKAEIHKEIMEMPDGYDTYIGERGVMLSGGQKQRISIARVFLKNPPVLILDEATSALDTVTEVKIQKALDELSVGRTSIVIAHRLSTIRNADRIAVVEDEHIREIGTHAELLEKGGLYAELYYSQTFTEQFNNKNPVPVERDFYYLIISRKSASLMTGIPRLSALVSLLPAFSPAST